MPKLRISRWAAADHRLLYLCHVWLGVVTLCLFVGAGPFSVIVVLLGTFISFAYLDERALTERRGQKSEREQR